MDPRERNIRVRLRDDFEHYAAKCLRIRTKSGKVEPLLLNKAQRYLHERLEAQIAKTGRVRALVLKGRQQGISTYISGRYYWQSTHRKGCRVFILTHEDEATNNLFGMVQRYHENCPALVRPGTNAANAKELSFGNLDSGYKVGTAGTKAVGRSQTIQLFHGSEVAFWPHADTHFAGVLQAIADMPGTEILLESTANGVGGEFHARWQDAEAGVSGYEAIFIPWYWQDEYRKEPPDDFSLTDEEWEYAEAYNLDDDQMAWRRHKIAELKDPDLFRQEYPATAAEAFQMTGHDSFIKAADIMRCRKATLSASGPVVGGADPARYGDDRFSVILRRGRKVIKKESRTKLDTTAGAAWLRDLIDEYRVAMMFIDAGGLGIGVYDTLVTWGYGDRVKAVNFGGKPLKPQRYSNGRPLPSPINRRAEMWMDMRDAILDAGGLDIPDEDGLQADLQGPGYKYMGADQKIQLESKEEMRKRGIRSPDEGDALALTFAEPVADEDPDEILYDEGDYSTGYGTGY